jgi:hypothetical protein
MTKDEHQTLLQTCGLLRDLLEMQAATNRAIAGLYISLGKLDLPGWKEARAHGQEESLFATDKSHTVRELHTRIGEIAASLQKNPPHD